MSGWAALRSELDRWQDTGRSADFWWRDDDAADAAPALERLLDMATRHGAPLALAVIPSRATQALARRLTASGLATVLQHGYAHRNHAPADQKKSELGATRQPDEVLQELSDGRDRLAALFGGPPPGVLVPPWNRIAEGLVERLPSAGFHGLSTFAPRRSAQPSQGLTQVNAHVDIIDWKGTRSFAGEEAVLAAAVRHLSARRRGEADPGEPTGLLSHHLDHDAGCWAFLDAFLAETQAHPACRWRAAADLFAPPGKDATSGRSA